jgi:hypothetical protein
MKKLTIITAVITLISVSCVSKPMKYKSDFKTCVVTQVEEFSPGEIHTLQTDYVWRATTNCGGRFSSTRRIDVGDTIVMEFRKYVK